MAGLFQMLFLVGIVVSCSSSEDTTTTTTSPQVLVTTTQEPEGTETVVAETTPSAPADEANKGKRTIDQQLGYGHNDLQPRFQRPRPEQQQRRVLQPQRGGFYQQQPEYSYQQEPQRVYIKPQQQAFIPSPLYADAPVANPAPQLYPEVAAQQGYASNPALSSPLFGPSLFGSPLLLPGAGAQFVPVIILRLHDTGAGPQVAQAFPALLHAPPPAQPAVLQTPGLNLPAPGLNLQALQSLLFQQQYQPAETYQQPYVEPGPEKVVYIAPPGHKAAYGSKKPAPGPALLQAKLRKTAQEPDQQEALHPNYKYNPYKDKPQ